MSQQPVRAWVRPGDGFEIIRRVADQLQAFRKTFDVHSTDVWRPPTDVYETAREIIVKMSIPGLAKGNIRILFEGDLLVIGGYRRAQHEPDLAAYHQMEIRSGCFERRLVIHKPINPDAMTVDYRDGFLWVRVPKAPIGAQGPFAVRFTIQTGA